MPRSEDRDSSRPRPAQAHDTLLREVFRETKNARAILRTVLPRELVRRIDLRTLRPEPIRFADPSLRQQFADLVFRVRLRGGGDARIHLLIEHSRSPRGRLPLRILG